MLITDLLPNEEKRIAALHSYNILDTESEQDFDDLTELASIICNVPIALISFVDTDRLWFKSRKGLEVTQTDRSQSFCEYAIMNPNEVMVVEDARADERFKDNPLVTGWLNLTFYAGVPLVNEDGYALGSLCVLDKKKRQLSEEQTTALRILARQVTDKLELRRRNKRLDETNKRLTETEAANGRLHEEISESEARLRNLVKQAPVMMATFMGPDYVIDLFNDKMPELWGRTAEQIQGLPLFTALPEAFDKSYADLLKQVYTTGKGKLVRETPRTVMRNGRKQTIWLDARYEALRDGNDAIAGIIMIGTDVTDSVTTKRDARKLQDALTSAHRELKEKERNLRIAIEAANLDTWALDFATHEFSASVALKEQFGFSPDETVVLEQVINIVDRPFVPAVQNAIEAALKKEDSMVEYPIQNPKTGERKWMRSVGKAEWDAGGNAVRLIGMNADITAEKEYDLKVERLNAELSATNKELQKAYNELRYANNKLQQRGEELVHSHAQLAESEENLRMAIDAANLGMWVMNLETGEYTVSETFKSFYGFAPGCAVTVEDVVAQIDARYITGLTNTIDRCVAEMGSIDSEFIIHKKDTGEARWIRKFGKVLTDESRKPTLFIGMNADITSRKENEEKIRNLNEELLSINTQMQGVNDDLLSANDELLKREEELTASYERLSAGEEQLRIATEAANLGMWNLNLQSGQLVVSDNLKRMYGFAVTEEITVENLFDVVKPEDKARVEKLTDEAKETGNPIQVDWSIAYQVTGEERCLRAVGKMERDVEGKPLRLIGMTTDITEQKKALDEIEKLNRELLETVARLSEQEEVLQIALRSADIGLWQIDLGNNATILSERMKEIHGMPPDRNITFDEALSTVAAEFRQFVNESVVWAVNTGELFVADYKINRMDGSGTAWVRSTGIMKVYDEGKRRILIGACIDITGQKRDDEGLLV